MNDICTVDHSINLKTKNTKEVVEYNAMLDVVSHHLESERKFSDLLLVC